MNEPSQRRAVKVYRQRLADRGLARFEVLGRTADRDLIRALARHLAEDGQGADRLRDAVSRGLSGQPPRTGGIFAALRRSPLVGAELDLTREVEPGRQVEL